MFDPSNKYKYLQKLHYQTILVRTRVFQISSKNHYFILIQTLKFMIHSKVLFNKKKELNCHTFWQESKSIYFIHIKIAVGFINSSVLLAQNYPIFRSKNPNLKFKNSQAKNSIFYVFFFNFLKFISFKIFVRNKCLCNYTAHFQHFQNADCFENIK